MDNFKVIYKILKILEEAMDVQDFDESMLSPDMFKISQTRLDAILVMLQNDGYISGLIPVRFGRMTGVKFDNVRITLKGLEYLAENSFMKKAANIAKGIADLIP
ncbi:MAG: YjcQ family protein [Oscillospiraceae bacterium]|jgi:DNA-binding PadR family transcriptional regulator|nr:YjcQ family protein [Oscillospiraceae bacterium]